MIHVCFGLYDKNGTYSKFTGTTVMSIFENTISQVTVHILHDNTLTLDNRDKFSYLAGQYGQLVKFYNVEELCADKISEMVRLMPSAKTSIFSIAMLYRLVIPQLLSDDIEKTIYLDSDIIVNLDINELWRIDLGDKVLGVIPEVLNGVNPQIFALCRDNIVKGKDYFNSGVLLMNLKILREKEDYINRGLKFIGERNGYWDQDTLNYCFATQTLKLPLKFNRFIDFARIHHETRIEKKIYHYVGQHLQLNMNDPFNRLWMKYFAKTPWFNEETIGRLYSEVRKMDIGLKNSMVQISAIMSGKTRAFFTLPQNAESVKKIFSVRDDEEIILAENQSSLQKLIDAMKASAGQKVFFILFPNFPFQALVQAGFVYGRDFLDVLYFLSEANGVPLYSYSMVKAM